jgi:hypothetical protein
MHPVRGENINRSGKRRGDGRDEDCESPVLQFFNNECWDKSLLNLDERRLPRIVVILPVKSMSKASEERVPGNSIE